MTPTIPSLDKTQSVLLIAGVALIAYMVYQAKQAASAGMTSAARIYNQLGNTVRQGIQDGQTYNDAMPGVAGMPTASQIIANLQSIGTNTVNPYEVDPATGEVPWNSTPDGFIAGSKRMRKPSYGRLSQPNSAYVQ